MFSFFDSNPVWSLFILHVVVCLTTVP